LNNGGRGGVLHKPLLYLSYYFKKNRWEFYDRLNIIRETGNYEQWVDYFLKGVVDIAGVAMDTVRQILEPTFIYAVKCPGGDGPLIGNIPDVGMCAMRCFKGSRKQPPEYHLIESVFSDKGNGCRCEKSLLFVVNVLGK